MKRPYCYVWEKFIWFVFWCNASTHVPSNMLGVKFLDYNSQSEGIVSHFLASLLGTDFSMLSFYLLCCIFKIFCENYLCHSAPKMKHQSYCKLDLAAIATQPHKAQLHSEQKEFLTFLFAHETRLSEKSNPSFLKLLGCCSLCRE